MAKLTVEQALLRAKSQANKGEFDQAKALYESVLAAFPNNKRAKQALANLNTPEPIQTGLKIPPQELINALTALYNQRQFTQAADQAKRLTQEYPNSFVLWNLSGAVNKALGILDKAEQGFRRASEINPKYPDAHNNLGVTLKDQGKLDEAIASYQQALELKPDYAAAYYNMGTALKDQGKLDKAITSYQQALQLKPDYASAYNNMGNALKDQGKLDEAITSYQQALQLKPDYASAYNNMGIALKDQGKLDEAIASYQQALELKPDYASSYNNLGIALKDQGKLDEAIMSYQQALQLKPDYAEAAKNIVKLPIASLSQKALDLVELYLRNIDDMASSTSSLQFLKANYLMHCKNYDSAFIKFCEANIRKYEEVADKLGDLNDKYERSHKRIRKWSPKIQPLAKIRIKKIFILGSSRSGKSSLEQILSKSRKVLPKYEAINLSCLRGLGVDLSNNRETTFKDFFYEEEEILLEKGYKIATSTNPTSLFYLDFIHDCLEDCYFIFLNRNILDVASEVFIKEYNNENYYSYDAVEIMKYLRIYNGVSNVFSTKVPDRSMQVTFDEIRENPSRVVEKISQFMNTNFYIENYENKTAKASGESPFRTHFKNMILGGDGSDITEI
ncbi:tetratricopeptide repeat protein [Tateyamaria pelophila]|uniref:tetratricopeptide repeat protein n=1 Tax=Tateyamaria pelophila TaxID=328415 RepID=UPI001CBF1291|nr:tetratricopeptide repeat protein [Tateyamaria pelophila]